MALSKLTSLYQAIISEQASNPAYRGHISGGSVIELHNPTCGDVIALSLLLDEAGTIVDIAFEGEGCTISMASASMMCAAVKGKKDKDSLSLAGLFSDMIQGKTDHQEVEMLGEAAALSGVSQFPQRIKCATLSWNALKKALEVEGKRR